MEATVGESRTVMEILCDREIQDTASGESITPSNLDLVLAILEADMGNLVESRLGNYNSLSWHHNILTQDNKRRLVSSGQGRPITDSFPLRKYQGHGFQDDYKRVFRDALIDCSRIKDDTPLKVHMVLYAFKEPDRG